MTFKNQDGLYDGECNRCNAFADNCADTREKQKKNMLEKGWTFKPTTCYCPKCSGLMQAWANTKARVETYALTNLYFDELDEKAIASDLDIIEKQLNL